MSGGAVCGDGLLSLLQEYITRQMNERSDAENKFHAMKDDLITRLQNACNQRDEARGQVRMDSALPLLLYAHCHARAAGKRRRLQSPGW